MPKYITLDEQKEIVAYYKTKPMTIKELADSFNISNPSAIKILDRFGVARYKKTKLFSPNFQENYFENIDTPNKAYFLGLIITDGCVCLSKRGEDIVSLILKDRDRYLLEEFKKEVKSNKNVTSDGRGSSGLNLLSNRMASDLIKLGVVPRKSNTTIFPKNLSRELYPHLIRGMIDGDGSVAFYARKSKKTHIKNVSICQGNKAFLEDFSAFLNQEIGTSIRNLYQEKESLWSIRYQSIEDMVKVYKYLYTSYPITMKRKKQLYDKIIEEIIFYHGNTEITHDLKVL